jgi:hypothetical protein
MGVPPVRFNRIQIAKTRDSRARRPCHYMKTPRELLLDRHRAAQSKLNAIRQGALASMEKDAPERSSMTLRDILRSFRWHLAGMGAVWVFVLFLHLDTSRAPQMMATVPPAKTLSRQFIMVSVRENRRQLSEMIEAQPPAGEHRELFLPKPRSERRFEMLLT